MGGGDGLPDGSGGGVRSEDEIGETSGSGSGSEDSGGGSRDPRLLIGLCMLLYVFRRDDSVYHKLRSWNNATVPSVCESLLYRSRWLHPVTEALRGIEIHSDECH